MKGIDSISKLLLVLCLANAFRCFNASFDFKRMANKSVIRMIKTFQCFYPGIILEECGNVAIYKSRNPEESIKVLYPSQGSVFSSNKKKLFDNEIYILKQLNEQFGNDSVKNGIVRLFDGRQAEWKNYDDEKRLPNHCTAIIYTFGIPLFPILEECVQSNNRKMLFWYFSQMAKSLYFMESEGNILHNSIGPSVFRLSNNGEVFIENFEIARFIRNRRSNHIYVAENGFPIGFKPTMSERAIKNVRERDSECQRYSFKMTSYYILHKLPWHMDAIDFLWKSNMTEARELTLELQKIDLKEYYQPYGIWNEIIDKLYDVINKYSYNYRWMYKELERLCKNTP